MARPACGVISGGFWFCTLRDLCFHFFGSGGGGGCIVSSPGGVPASCVGLFLLCFACPPWLPLRLGAYVGGLVGVFLRLSVEAVWVRLITGRL